MDYISQVFSSKTDNHIGTNYHWKSDFEQKNYVTNQEYGRNQSELLLIQILKIKNNNQFKPDFEQKNFVAVRNIVQYKLKFEPKMGHNIIDYYEC